MNRLQKVETKLIQRKEALLRLQIENETLDKQIDEHIRRISDNMIQLELGQEALQFLEDVANSRRGEMKSQIENVVSEALSLIYDNDYGVELVYDVKNNRSFTEIKLLKKTSQGVVRRTMNGFGGGVSDTISVPLRLLVLLASRQTDRVCVLDEPWKHMDLTDRIDRAAEFIHEIAHRLDLQTVMCSHHEAMQEAADVAWRFSDDNGTTIVEKIK